MYNRLVKLFLRFAIAIGFLSAVADRFGMWHYHIAWGSWDSFVAYTQTVNPWIPNILIEPLAIIATACEIIFAAFLLVGFRTEFFAKLSGVLLLGFALSMTFSTGIKTALDASVYAASAGAFALGSMKEKYFELDTLISRSKK